MRRFLFFIFSFSFLSLIFSDSHPESTLSFPEYCKFYKYPVEEHTVNTEDGYILTYFRIQTRNTTSFRSLPVVFLQHGFLDSSDTFIVNSEPVENAPAFYFADRGFDVWVGNSRGNKYSRHHTYLNPDIDVEYWDISFQKMSIYDLPAGLSYIFQMTNKKISYIGHSQGTTQMWAALSERKENVQKYLKNFISLAPVVYLNHCKSNLINFLVRNEVDLVMKALNIHEILSPNWFSSVAGVKVCQYFTILCKGGLEIFADSDPEIDNYRRMDVIMGHFPAGTSMKDVNYWGQMVKSDFFKKYDYGPELNLHYYNQTTPPIYNLSNVNIPVSLFVGNEDKLGDITDARRLSEELTGVPYKFYKEYSKGHGTFIWGKEMNYLEEVEEEVRKFI